jgi:hypothetical protein
VREFEGAGGAAMLDGPEQQLEIGWRVWRNSEENLDTCRRLSNELSDNEEKYLAVRAHVIKRN